MNQPANSTALRIIDANANRAREALRVIEDYARFGLSSQKISADLKEIRHELANSLQSLLGEAILHRDTEGDVGTTNKTAAEFARQDIAHVVTAACKRLEEALRALEEFAKTFDGSIARRLETLRYRFYVLDQTIALTLVTPGRLEQVHLYVLISEDHCCSRPWLEVARQAIAGGADCLQLREKSLEGGELLRRARQFVELCRENGVISIINDRVDIAIAADADGVHLGQGDIPAREARKMLGKNKIIGVSTHQIEQARQAILDGADYIGVGPVFRSSTKTRDFVAGLDYVRQVVQEVTIPAVAIAGITQENVDQVIAAGLRRVAVTAAVTEQADVAVAARALKAKLTTLP